MPVSETEFESESEAVSDSAAVAVTGADSDTLLPVWAVGSKTILVKFDAYN